MSRTNWDRIDQVVGRNIRTIRIARQLSQTELGDRLDVTFQQIQKYEKGTNSVPSERLRQVCNVLGVTPNDLFSFGADKDAMPLPAMSAWATRLALKLDGLDLRVKSAVNGLVDGILASG